MSGTITTVATFMYPSEPGLTYSKGYLVSQSGPDSDMLEIVNDFGHYVSVPKMRFWKTAQHADLNREIKNLEAK